MRRNESGQSVLLATIFLCVLPGAVFVLPGAAQQPRLGSLGGEGLPPTDLARVQVGMTAPDFRLVDETGAVHQLSQYRDTKNVVLVVYRGHW